MPKTDEINRRQFVKMSLAAGAGLALLQGLGTGAFASGKAGGLAGLPVSLLEQKIRKGELTATKLVHLYLERIAKYDGRAGLNSFITVAAKQALNQAEKLDAMAKRNQFAGPLHGIPVAVKDNLDTMEIVTTGGSKILSQWRPPQDAYAVARLKQAGAIILGKTNMHEFAFGITTNNPHYGPCRNPYDKTRIPGGSSGGSAAAVAADLCAAALGTDTGGSARIPAALCGVVGLKPTLGLVGRGGMMHLSFTRDCIGPITRSVADAAIMLEAIAGRDVRDPESAPAPSSVPQYSAFPRTGLKGKKFGLPRKYFFDNISADTARVMEKSLELIEKQGGQIKEVEVKHMDLATPTGFNIVLAEAVYLMEDYLRSFDPKATIDKYLEQMGPDVKAVLGSQKGTPKSNPVPGWLYSKSLRKDRKLMISGFAQALEGLDGLLLPTTPLPATKIGEDVEIMLNGKKANTFLTFIRNCDPVSVAGYPAISVPAGFSSEGLPIGLQIVARPWEEMNLLSLGYGFEQTAKARKPPKL
ncbi:MAG: Asp-tRNA(Asn)/Glu-tRNA(Gln) amidotransferase GatCAB subunit A [Proteobacteria bacterium]|nr:Asp-tRNA(Asn)/Glu-tRNA(Gln) amidotransferase GatCAB subunit A [Pseudomonadota bacterium]MBU1452212.1 Asp-tRNA(Asn)/Glu-tRNA(Gln) amidotransferase GatCAB subunit A [Pseudomonadota bacterium]MBU2467816.1 Asp-tRNA(Asn)/Glu-tRNA(Gln) amidotransferase GatCAB subunit A [Pseudomonadota bacterium]MBU2518674.1 Asp-tRNA(Asn)/Glu-tRNA(Gln) amidotransferase GatCAB subunit A [Pseudomonadota bacterium]